MEKPKDKHVIVCTRFGYAQVDLKQFDAIEETDEQIEEKPSEEQIDDKPKELVNPLDPLHMSDKTLEEMVKLRDAAQKDADEIQVKLDHLIARKKDILSKIVKVDFIWGRTGICEA